MKTPLLAVSMILTISLTVVSAASDCSLEVFKMTEKSKTFYLSNGEKVSKSVISKLNGPCKVQVKMLNAGQKRQLKIVKYKKMLAKLQTKKTVSK